MRVAKIGKTRLNRTNGQANFWTEPAITQRATFQFQVIINVRERQRIPGERGNKAEFTKTIPQFTEKVTKFLSYLEFELKPERIHLTHQL